MRCSTCTPASSPSSEQWQRAGEIVRRCPSLRRLRDRALESLSRERRPLTSRPRCARGSGTRRPSRCCPTGRRATSLILLRVADEPLARRFLEGAGQSTRQRHRGIVVRVYGDLAAAFVGEFMAIGSPANVRAAIDARRRGSLARVDRFRRAVDELQTDDPLAYAYAPARGIAQVLRGQRGPGRSDPLARRYARARGGRGRGAGGGQRRAARARHAGSGAASGEAVRADPDRGGARPARWPSSARPGSTGCSTSWSASAESTAPSAARPAPAPAPAARQRRGTRSAAGAATAAGTRGRSVRHPAGERPGGDTRGGRHDRGGGRQRARGAAAGDLPAAGKPRRRPGAGDHPAARSPGSRPPP